MSAWEGSAFQETKERTTKAPEANPSVEPKKQREIGPEKLSVRVFREVFVEAATKAGHLNSSLEEYLRKVLTNKSAKRSDKSEAKKIYTDSSLRLGGNGLPDWAKSLSPSNEETLSDDDIQKILQGVEPTRPPVETRATVEDFDLDALLDEENARMEKDPFLAEKGPFRSLIADFKPQSGHPFIRVFTVEGKRYVALGTLSGTFQVGQNTGKKINIHCTVNPYHRFRDVPDTLAVYRDGRQVSVHRDDELGLRRYLFCVRHIPGTKIRFWMRLDEKDEQGGARRILLTDDAEGWKKITRAEY